MSFFLIISTKRSATEKWKCACRNKNENWFSLDRKVSVLIILLSSNTPIFFLKNALKSNLVLVRLLFHSQEFGLERHQICVPGPVVLHQTVTLWPFNKFSTINWLFRIYSFAGSVQQRRLVTPEMPRKWINNRETDNQVRYIWHHHSEDMLPNFRPSRLLAPHHFIDFLETN